MNQDLTMSLKRITRRFVLSNSFIVKSKRFKNSCATTIWATPLYLKSIQSRHEVKFQYSQNNKMSLKKFQVIWQSQP